MEAGLAASCPDVFAVASDVLGIDVAALCRDGSSGQADLSSTRWAQPAVLVCSVASFRALVARGERFDAVLGHSVGEYAALVSAGAIELADAVSLIALRAGATEDAAALTPGGMAAVMRAERALIEEICTSTGASLAADNSAGQLVISGPIDAVEAAKEQLSAAGAAVRTLEVAGAFHSTAMQPARDAVAAALEGIAIGSPKLDLWSSTTAARVTDATGIRDLLIEQLTSPVLWRESVEAIAQEYEHEFIDIGPGKVVGGLAKRIVAGAQPRFAVDILAPSHSGTSQGGSA
jgi:[acyl-carrier-protein] S-malonyltransferase